MSKNVKIQKRPLNYKKNDQKIAKIPTEEN